MDAEEAQRIAASRYRHQLPDGSLAPMFATEFEEGFIVMPTLPQPPPPLPGEPRRLTSPGAAAVIVDKQTGEMTVLPYHGEEGTAHTYRRLRAQPPPPPPLPPSRARKRLGFWKHGGASASETGAG